MNTIETALRSYRYLLTKHHPDETKQIACATVALEELATLRAARVITVDKRVLDDVVNLPLRAAPAPDAGHVHAYAWAGSALIRDGLQIATFERAIPADIRTETVGRLNAGARTSLPAPDAVQKAAEEAFDVLNETHHIGRLARLKGIDSVAAILHKHGFGQHGGGEDSKRLLEAGIELDAALAKCTHLTGESETLDLERAKLKFRAAIDAARAKEATQ